MISPWNCDLKLSKLDLSVFDSQMKTNVQEAKNENPF